MCFKFWKRRKMVVKPQTNTPKPIIEPAPQPRQRYVETPTPRVVVEEDDDIITPLIGGAIIADLLSDDNSPSFDSSNDNSFDNSSNDNSGADFGGGDFGGGGAGGDF